jgi:elongation factor Ts
MSVTISAKDVAELRARTGAGMMDCKNALVEANGDMGAAAEILRKKGMAKAEKRAGRAAGAGFVYITPAEGGASATMIEVNCETDFVANTDDFRNLCADLVQVAHANATPGIHELGAEGGLLDVQHGAGTVGEAVKAASAKTGEAIVFRRVAKFANATVGVYRHFNGLVGALVEIAGATGPAALELAKEIALHVSSADPVAVRPEDIPAELLERERRIAEEQVAAEGKPENIRAKIVDGKVKKFAAERALLEQPFVKQPDQTVGQLVKAVPGATVVRFARFKVGEE